jgi:uncharacterized glyoxalase superfamily protein PhnB
MTQPTAQPVSQPKLLSLTPITPAGPDVEATIRFYEEELGFTTRFKDGQPATMAFVGRDDIELMLQQTNDTHWASQTAYRVRTANVEAFYKSLESRNSKAIHPNGKLAKKPWGSTEFAVIDPFGVCITFYEFPA